MGVLVERIQGLFFCKVAYSRYDVTSKMLQTEHISVILHIIQIRTQITHEIISQNSRLQCRTDNSLMKLGEGLRRSRKRYHVMLYPRPHPRALLEA
jgi:hypothetical protein